MRAEDIAFGSVRNSKSETAKAAMRSALISTDFARRLRCKNSFYVTNVAWAPQPHGCGFWNGNRILSPHPTTRPKTTVRLLADKIMLLIQKLGEDRVVPPRVLRDYHNCGLDDVVLSGLRYYALR